MGSAPNSYTGSQMPRARHTVDNLGPGGEAGVRLWKLGHSKAAVYAGALEIQMHSLARCMFRKDTRRH